MINLTYRTPDNQIKFGFTNFPVKQTPKNMLVDRIIHYLFTDTESVDGDPTYGGDLNAILVGNIIDKSTLDLQMAVVMQNTYNFMKQFETENNISNTAERLASLSIVSSSIEDSSYSITINITSEDNTSVILSR
jgi:hypothetical protein